MTRIIRTGLPLERRVLDAASACIRSGGTLIFPTDSVYGFGCDPENEMAIESLFAAKGRPSAKPLAIHVAQQADARSFAILTTAARLVIECFWPGPIAIVMPRKPGACEAAARGGRTISVRCPSYEPCREILRATGPIAATSANISGQPPFDGARESAQQLPEATLAIITGPTPARRESTVVDCSSSPVKILREGAVSGQEIARALESSGVQFTGQAGTS